MSIINLILTVSIMNLIGVIIPGAGFLLVFKNAMHSKRIGFYTGLGIAFGDLFHILYSILIIYFSFYNSELLLSIIKYLGGSYLFIIGFKAIFLSKELNVNELKNDKVVIKSSLKATKEGFLVTVLNPNSSLMFISIFMLFIDNNINNSIIILIILIFFITPILWFLFVSIVLSHSKTKKLLLKKQDLLNKVFGVLIIFLAIKLLSS